MNSMKRIRTVTFGALLCLILASSAAWAAPQAASGPTPQAKDKCPVCGMFVAKYPDFLAQVQFRDGTRYFFDGPKDMFTYYLNVPRYTPGKKSADITSILVTGYYDLTMINGQTAWYVTGSDVTGPMGRELVPFARENQAREFMRDHRGKNVIRFKDVTPSLIKQLE